MNLALLDWIIVAALVTILTTAAITTRQYANSVSGFLAANRCAGRYLISVAFNMAQLGVITLVWYFQQNYDVGFTSIWWSLMEGPALILIALSGWVIYRFRRTRAMTLAQFFEMRYSKRFRIFAGLVAFVSGIINYGIFPGVAARFFIVLCGLPEQFTLFGQTVSTFVALMIGLMSIALFFVFLGGQIAVMVTDFLQGVFSNVAFLVLIGFILFQIPWAHMSETLLGQVHNGSYVLAGITPLAGKSLVDPFDLSRETNFDVFYWLISVVVLFYGMRAWQGDQGYNAAAKSAHEARMANILSGWRWRVLMLITVVLPIAIRTLMHHPAYAAEASFAHEGLAGLATDALRAEERTPLVAALLLPTGLLGLFTAAMLGAFISTNDTYLHSWGTIFVQDVVLPFRKKPLSTRAHLALLKGAILVVAVFTILFSLHYEPSQYISMFLALTGAVFVGGAGSAIIGGLYWKRGTTQAAWTAMVLGLLTSSAGILVKQEFMRGVFERAVNSGSWWSALAELGLALNTGAAVTGQVLTFVTILVSIGSYVLVSLLGPQSNCNLDQLLHRGKYEHAEERALSQTQHAPWLEKLGFDPEFTGSDKWITLVTISWPLVWTLIFIAGTVYNLNVEVSDETWLAWWRAWLWFTFGSGIVVMTWFTIGGFKDLRSLFRSLREFRVQEQDDGSIHGEDN